MRRETGDGTGRPPTDREPTGSVIAAEGLGFRYLPPGQRRRFPPRRGTPAGTPPERDAAAPGGDVLRDLDLACGPGEVIGVLGPNGAGKSTLLRLLATALRPTAGRLRLLGEDAMRPGSSLRRRIGYAAEEAVHFDAIAGIHNALFFARAAGIAPGAALGATRELLRRFELEADAATPAGRYSYGMRRKLLLTGAMAHDPELLILDEPTLGLDPPAQAALRDELTARSARGRTIVLATHDVTAARRLCTRIVFLHRGRKVLEGTPGELIRRLDGTTLIEIDIHPAEFHIPDLPGTRLASATPDRITMHAAGTAALPALCAAMLDAGVRIRAIRIREPDLRLAFRQVTGAELEPPATKP